MIVVAEPTYADDEHAAINAAVLGSIFLACGPVVFAATTLQQAGVAAATTAGPLNVPVEAITVLPPGGVTLRRMRHQWRTLSGLVRRHRPRTLVLLSAGPETLFVTRLLVTRYPGLSIFAIMHGNLSTIVGWRSRDPRRRLIDLRSGLRVARHRRIRLIVLEADIRDRIASLIPNKFLVWPMPTNGFEQARPATWAAPARLTLTFVGTANRRKGFGDVLMLHKQSGDLYDWTVAGSLSGEFTPDEIRGLKRPAQRLSRADYISEVRRADYAIMPFGQEYALTASASLLDCVTQRKPIIALRNSMLSGLQAGYGPFGYLCDDLAAMRDLLSHPERLRDEGAYAGFQRTLDAIHAARLPEVLAVTVRKDLGC